MLNSELTPHDQKLAELCEQAITEGRELAEWCLSPTTKFRTYALPSNQRSFLKHENEAFFGELAINGGDRSVMGCKQRVSLGRFDGLRSGSEFRDFVLGDFLTHAHWTYRNGRAGGFTIHKSIFSSPTGEYARFARHDTKGPVDWRALNSGYSWVMLTIDLHDFAFELGPLTKPVRQAVCVVQHPAFCLETQAPRHRITVGYPFVRYAPRRNVFGFGPGKFGAAIKLYTFEIRDDDSLSVEMLFAAAPRSEKVIDFGRAIPDPIYGGAKLAERLTFGRWTAAPFHDWLDSQMLAIHCRVHQSLIEGVVTQLRSRTRL